jgi:hypothetical protein
MAGCANDGGDESRGQPVPRAARVAFVSPPPARSPSTTAIALDGHPGAIIAAEEGVWVTVYRGAHSSAVARIDPATNRIAASVRAEGNLSDIAAGHGSVWVTGDLAKGGAVLHRIDPETNRLVATAHFACCYAGPVAAGEGAVWVVLTDREVRSVSMARLDANADEPTVLIPLEGAQARHNFDEVAVGMGSVWVLALEGLDHPGDIVRVDPETNRVEARVRAEALNMGAGPGGLWITGCVDCDEHRDTFFAQEIDVDTNEPSGPRLAMERVASGPLFVDEESTWFAGSGRRSDTIAFRLDSETHAIEEYLRIGDFVHSGMAFDARRTAIWVTRSAPPSVVRVQLDSRAN